MGEVTGGGGSRRAPRQGSLRILVVGINFAPEVTGIAPYTSALAAGLVARGHQVRALTAMPHYPEWRLRPGYDGWRRSEVIDGVQVERLLHHVPKRPLGVGRLVSEITFGLRVLTARWGRPDVVIFVSPALFATRIAMVRARLGRLRNRCIVWVQDLYSRGIVETAGVDPNDPVARIIRATEAAVLRQARAVVVIHEGFVGQAVELGARPEDLHVVRNWTHLRQRDGEDRAAVRRRLGWRDGEVIALHSGNMGVKQALGNLVDAARLADERDAHVRFVFTGTGSERDLLEERARALGVRRIRFLDTVAQHDFPATLDAADVLLLNEAPGLREMAMPSKLTSYFSAGRPVVAATDAASLSAREVETSGAGVRVDPADPAALLDEIERIVGDSDLMAQLGGNGRRYSSERLDADAAVSAFESLLLGVARKGSASARSSRAR
jgi:colanic acid biosynthesis glycosyl transferase WcaI